MNKFLIFLLTLICIFFIYVERHVIREFLSNNELEIEEPSVPDKERELKIKEAEEQITLWEAEIESDKNDMKVAAIEVKHADTHLERLSKLDLVGAIAQREYQVALERSELATLAFLQSKIDLKKSESQLRVRQIQKELAEIGSWSIHINQPRYGRVVKK